MASNIVVRLANEELAEPKAPLISVANCAELDTNPDVCPEPASNDVTRVENEADGAVNDPDIDIANCADEETVPAGTDAIPPPPPNPLLTADAEINVSDIKDDDIANDEVKTVIEDV